MALRTVLATRYVTPLREGGSLPAVIEADDGRLYVMKFIGAGQGPKALVAEVIAGEVGRALGLPVPELVLVVLDNALGPSEPNEEIRDLLRASVGLNLGMAFVPNAFAFNPLLQPPPPADLASAIVWFDAYITNVDRTVRNTNILVTGQNLWLIDHGASLVFHHDWRDYLARSLSPWPLVKDHVLLPFAAELELADAGVRPRLSAALLSEIVGLVPEIWLERAPFANTTDHRQAYVDFLTSRLAAAPAFVAEALNARSRLI